MRKAALALGVVLLLIGTQVSLAGALTVKLDPAKVTVPGVGSTFNMSVLIEGVTNLGGFQFSVNYDPTIVTVQSAALGPFLGSTGRSATALGPTIDNNTGKTTFGGFSFGANAGPDGNGVLATITFSVKSQTAGALDLNNVQVTNIQGTAITVDVTEGATLQVTAPTPETRAIPTMTEWGMIIFSLLMAGSAVWMMRRRNI